MTKLFDRVIKVTIDTDIYEDFRIGFNAEVSLLSSPNTANITIYNLSKATRDKIKKSKDGGFRS